MAPWLSSIRLNVGQTDGLHIELDSCEKMRRRVKREVVETEATKNS